MLIKNNIHYDAVRVANLSAVYAGTGAFIWDDSIRKGKSIALSLRTLLALLHSPPGLLVLGPL